MEKDNGKVGPSKVGADMQATAFADGPSFERSRSRGRHSTWLLWLLLAIAVALRSWQVVNATVPSRDSVAFVRFAWHLNDHSWRDVMGASDRHPGYPIAIYAVAKLTGAFHSASPALAMQFAAQAVSAIAGALLVFPTFFLARRWFGAGAAFASSFLLLLVPVGNQIMADGISDGLFLALLVMAIWRLDRAFARGRLLDFATGGLASGAAFWVRPEGLALIPIAGVVLLAVHFRSSQRSPWKLAASVAGLGAPVVLCVAGFTHMTGRLLVKPTASVLLTDSAPAHPNASAHADCFHLQLQRLHQLAHTLENDSQFAASTTPVTEHVVLKPAPPASESSRAEAVPDSRWKLTLPGLVKGTGMVVRELFEGSFYYLPLFALVGAWWHRRTLRCEPAMWLLMGMSAGILALMVMVAGRLNYVSDRHLLIVIFTMMLWAGAGIQGLAQRLSACQPGVSPRWVAAGLMLALTAPIVPKNVLPLHAERAGFRQAGLWVADHRGPADQVVDVYGWALYYAGDAFRPAAELTPTVEPRGTVYLIVPQSERRTSVVEIETVKRLTRFGTEVYRSSSPRHAVAVYAVPMRRGNG